MSGRELVLEQRRRLWIPFASVLAATVVWLALVVVGAFGFIVAMGIEGVREGCADEECDADMEYLVVSSSTFPWHCRLRALFALILQRLLQDAGLRLPLGELLRRYSLTLLGMVFVAVLVLKTLPPVLGPLAALSAPFVHAWHVGRTLTTLRA